MKTVLLEEKEILDTKRSWKDIIGCVNSDPKSINIFKQKRIKEFVENCYTDKKLSTDMDLATLLILLKHRNCSVTIPYYENLGVKKEKSNVIKIGNKTKGKIIGLKSNQNTFNFSVTIADEKYIEQKLSKDFAFAPRTYTLTDYDGKLGDNWKTFNFDMTDEEKEYFSKNIGVDNFYVSTHFVNPQLAQCMYTDYYFNCKIFIERLSAERKYITNIKKEYLPKCKVQSNSEFEYVIESTISDEEKGKFESVKVLCFETRPQMDNLDFDFNYINVKRKPEEIVAECNFLLEGYNDVISEYRFLCRMIECAFTLMNPYKEDLKPTDFQTYNNRYECKWNEQKVKLPRSKIEWFELMFKNHSLLCRYHYKSIQQKIKEI